MNKIEEISDIVAQLQKAKVDLSNAIEENAKQAERKLDELFLNVINVLDVFYKAEQTIREHQWDASDESKKCIGRFKNVEKRLVKLLDENEVQKIIFPDGKAIYDLCSIVDTEPDSSQSNDTIISIEKDGYVRKGNRLLRRAEIVVVKN